MQEFHIPVSLIRCGVGYAEQLLQCRVQAGKYFGLISACIIAQVPVLHNFGFIHHRFYPVIVHLRKYRISNCIVVHRTDFARNHQQFRRFFSGIKLNPQRNHPVTGTIGIRRQCFNPHFGVRHKICPAGKPQRLEMKGQAAGTVFFQKPERPAGFIFTAKFGTYRSGDRKLTGRFGSQTGIYIFPFIGQVEIPLQFSSLFFRKLHSIGCGFVAWVNSNFFFFKSDFQCI